MDLELDKYVFFQDEAVVLRCIKYDQVDLLRQYLDKHSHGLDDQIVDRMFNFTVTLIKPNCFKLLCSFFPDRIPTDVLKQLFHAVLCIKQDIDAMPISTERECDAAQSRADDLSDDITLIGELVLFLKEHNALTKDDKDDAMEIVEEYKLEDVLGRIINLF